MPAIKARSPRVASVHQVIQVGDMTGGMNLRLDPTLLNERQARILRNWDISEPGALKVHPGYDQFTSTSLGANRAQGGERVYLSSHTMTLVAHGQQVWDIDAAGSASTVLSGLSTNQVYFPYDRDMVVVLDGTNRPQKSTNGSSWTNFGIDQPSTGPTVSTAGGGDASSGQYAFAYTYKQRSLAYESNVSAESTITLSGSTGAFHLTAAASTEAHVDAYVWYGRDITAGETVLRKISSGAASTYTVTSTAWTANTEAPTNHTVLAKGLFGTVWKNRWWVVDPDQRNRLHFSEIFLPQAFPALYYVDIPFQRGDEITAVIPLGDILVVFGQSRTFLIIGQTSLDFEVRPSAGSIAGALGPRAVDQVEQGIVHAAAEGVYIFDGAQDRLLTYLIEQGWRDYVTGAGGAELEKTPLIYESRRKVVRVGVSRCYPTGAPGEWELSLDRSGEEGEEAWTQTDRNVGGYIHFNGNEPTAGNRGELLSWSDTTGLLFKESTGTTANSSNMVAVYEGPTINLGLHRSRVIDLHGEYEPHSGSLTEETLVDSVSQGQRSLSIGASIAQWGTAVWGTFIWGGSGRRKFHIMRPLSADGRNIQQKFTYSGTEQYRQFTYAFTILPETTPRQFTE